MAIAEVRPGYLYRYWSASRELLYIGISINAVARMGQHRGKVWFPDVATINVQKFDTYAEAEVAEVRAIYREKPLHNVRRPKNADELKAEIKRLRAAQKRAAGLEPLRIRRLRDKYEVDSAFGTIPEGTTFEQYAERPKWYQSWYERERAKKAEPY